MSSTLLVALITGAAQRIGADIARQLHSQGYTIILHYCHSERAARQLAAELNQQRANSCQRLQADLLDTNAVIQLASDAVQLHGHVDVLVNNASSFYPTPLSQATQQDWDTLFNSNLKGAYFLCQQLTETLRQRRGCIVNMVDIYSERPMKNHSLYCMAKAGLAMMTKALARELAPEIRVNGVSPGAILWPEDELTEQKKADILGRVPMQSLGSSKDIANTVAFLVQQAPYITGHIIAVDGGRSINM
jgi:pteridine reductase